jgi:branched-chain amino acid transport system substrate-binding protein
MNAHCTRFFGALIVAALGFGASAAQAQGTIKIGIIGPNSGPYSVIGEEVRNGFDLFFAEAGAQAAGKKIELLYEDAQAKPDVGLTKVKKLVELDKVDFLAGIVSSSVAYAVRDYVVSKGVPLLVSVASADGLTQAQGAPNIFRTNGSGSQDSHPFGKWLYDQGYRKLIVMAPGYAMGYEQTGGFNRTFTAAGGKIVKTLYPPVGAADFGPFLTSFTPSSADAIAAVFAGSDAIKFVKQFAEYGLKGRVPLVGTSLLTDDLILAQEGEAAVGIVTSGHYSETLDNPTNKAFVAAYQKRFRRPPTLYSEASYVGARVIRDAVEAVKGDVSNKSAVLEAVRKAEFDAPRGRFRFDGMNSPIHTVYIFRVEKKEGRLVNNAIAKYENVSQFYTWEPKQFMAMPNYSDIANDWAK